MSKAIFFLLLLGGIGFAKGVFKRYPMKSGMIFYDINTTAHSSEFDTHKTGIARLIFDNWGAKELKEEDTTEVQTGDFQETHDHRSISLIDNGTIYTVDFNDDTIYKTRDRSLDLSIAEGEDLSNENIKLIKDMKGIKVGTDNVAGFDCDVWKVKDQEICLYKGIPLRITVKNEGFFSERKAVQVVLNKEIPPEQFKLPDFPIVVDDDYSSDESAKVRMEDMIASIHDLRGKLKSMGLEDMDENLSLSPQQEREIIDTLGARYLAKQKKYLPELLKEMKKAKECIKNAKSGDEAKACMKKVNEINDKLGDKSTYFDFSKFDKIRDKILDSINDEINYLKLTNECVKQYNKTSEVIICTEGSLSQDEK
jgi:hypothetical protein